jgi:hypothetical protein
MQITDKIHADLQLVAKLVREFPAKPSIDASLLALESEHIIEAIIPLLRPGKEDKFACSIEQFAAELKQQSGYIVIKFNADKIEVVRELNKPVCCSKHAEMIFRTVVMAHTHSINTKDSNAQQSELSRVMPLLYAVSQALLKANHINERTILRSENKYA